MNQLVCLSLALALLVAAMADGAVLRRRIVKKRPRQSRQLFAVPAVGPTAIPAAVQPAIQVGPHPSLTLSNPARILHPSARRLAAANAAPIVVPTPIVPAPIAPAFRVAPVAPIAPAPILPVRAAKAFPAPAVVPVRAAPAANPAPVVPAPEPVVVARAQPASNSYIPPPAARVALPAVPAPVVAPPVVAARVALPTPVIAPAPIVPAGPRAVPVAFRSVYNAPGTQVNNLDEWNYAFEADNGIRQEATGVMKAMDDGHEVIVMRGSYEYVGADALTYVVDWVADENGFRASAPHLPKSVVPIFPEVQAAVDAQLAFAAANPEPLIIEQF